MTLETFDEHEGGQLRLTCAGEQVPLLLLPDAEIPTLDEPQAVDELTTTMHGEEG